MKWMADDFKRERKFKEQLARKASKRILLWHNKKRGKAGRMIKDEVERRKKLAATVSREIKKFWAKIGQLVKYKHQQKLEVHKKAVLERRLENLEDITAKMQTDLVKDMRSGPGAAKADKEKAAAAAKEAKEAKSESKRMKKDADGDFVPADDQDDLTTFNEEEVCPFSHLPWVQFASFPHRFSFMFTGQDFEAGGAGRAGHAQARIRAAAGGPAAGPEAREPFVPQVEAAAAQEACLCLCWLG
jgi:hypothetical protein